MSLLLILLAGEFVGALLFVPLLVSRRRAAAECRRSDARYLALMHRTRLHRESAEIAAEAERDGITDGGLL